MAEDIGGRVQPGSGAPDFYKSDVRAIGDLRVECKTTSKSSYTLKFEDLQKISLEALQGGVEDWVMQIEFQRAIGNSKKFAILPFPTFTQLAYAALPDYKFLVTSIDTDKKSIKLKLDELFAGLGKALSQPGYNLWVISITQGFRTYALVDWDTYIYARELRPREDQEP